MKKSKQNKQYTAARKVVVAIESCATTEQLKAAKRFADAYHIMFQTEEWGFLYDDDIIEALCEKNFELHIN
jgi:hypothetical protein